MKPKIHFHSDCSFFAGCENMLSVLFNNSKFNKDFKFSFSYNFSKEYEYGLEKRINHIITKYPLKLSKPSSSQANRIIRFLIKIMQPIYFLCDTYKIYKIINRENPDIIHINNGGYPGALSCSAAVFSARLAGKTKIIYVVNNIAFPIKSFQRGLLYPIDLFVSKNVSKFITASERAKKSLEKVLSLKNEKVLQIPNTIVPRKINTQKEMFRKKYGINKDDILIGCVALFIERKGHVYLINAFSEFLKHYNGKNNVYLILDGNGDKKDEIKKLINELKLNKNIILTELANIYDLYNAMDFLVLASIEKEDFPNVIIESMYMGKPVIGTDVGGIPEQIKDGYNGEIVKPRNTKELGNAILKLVNDKKYSKKLGKNGKKLFEDKFSENTIVGRYIKLYNVLVNERNKK